MYRYGLEASAARRAARPGTVAITSSTASKARSDSPMKTASKNGASGAGLEALGPPATTIGSSSPRSAALSGMPARSSTSSTLEYVSSACSVIPSRSASRTGRHDSSVKSGSPCRRIASAMSGHGQYTRSAAIPARTFTCSYRIWRAWLEIPTSYASG